MEASRVAEIIAEFPNGTDRGSGYRTSDTTVLTAAHVVANATRVRVRFDADTESEWETVATAVWSDADSDLAVLSIESREAGLTPVRFGRIGDRDAVLPATAVGFPLWKLKNYDGTVVTDDGRPRYRDTHHANGMVAVLSNRREGTLEVTVAPPDRDADPEPWQGMSGAALWMGDRVVGVVARHHRADGLGRLTAVRLDRALTAELGELLGITEPLADVVGPHESELVRTDYRKQVEAIAPRELLDRENELAELTRFVAGDASYTWWRAGPWAGKTALMSWFVLHPPEGVDVVSFFVTRSLGGQRDSDAFTKALTQQLAALSGEAPSDDGLWRLVEDAGTRSRRLLVVIDGLDEDSGPAQGKPSIASLLPPHPPPNVRVLVASRPDPRVPDDVIDEDHPLLTCPRRDLTASPHARSIGRRAVHELNQHLRGDALDRDVLGLITASGGGLTRGDLAELTGRPPYEIDRLLDGPLGRTIGSRPAPLRPTENGPVHLFAHETLGATARDKFGTSVRAYRTRINAWADAYREKGWPADTPQYLLIGYPGMLVEAGDHERLVAVSTDRARHDRMLLVSGGDGLAASEIRQAQDVLSREPDLSGLLLLAAHNDELARRNSGIPVRLPVVWAMLGDTARADALAHGVIDRESRARCLIALAEHAARTGDRERFAVLVAEVRSLARGLHSAGNVLAELAVAAAGDPDLVLSIVHDLPDRDRRNQVLRELAESAAATGDHELAHRLATGTSDLTYTLTRLARSAAANGDHEQAGSLLDRVTESKGRNQAVREFVRDAVVANDHERAHRLLGAITDPGTRAAGMAGAAEAAAANADYETALAFLAGVADPAVRATVLARSATAARDAGDHDRATSLLADAWTHTHAIADHNERAGARLAVIAGDPGPSPTRLAGTEDAVRAVLDAERRAELLSCLAEVTASAGGRAHARVLLAEAAELVGQVTGRFARNEVRRRVMRAAIAAGEYEQALAWPNGITEPAERAMAVATLVECADREHALALVDTIEDVEVRDRELAYLAKDDGDPERASSFARRITDGGRRTRTLLELAAAAGDHDRALLLADRIQDVRLRDDTLVRLATDAEEAGRFDRARAAAARITDDTERTSKQVKLARKVIASGAWQEAATCVHDLAGAATVESIMVDLVGAVANAGNPELAHTLALEAGHPGRLLETLTRLAEVALSVGDRDRARSLVAEVATIASTRPKPKDQSFWHRTAVDVAVAAGEREHAAAFARAIPYPDERARALTQVAEAAAEACDVHAARELVLEAEAGARNVDDGVSPGLSMALPIAAVLAGEPDRARRIVRANLRGQGRTHALGLLAVAATGTPELAGSLLAEAVAVADDIPNLYSRARALTGLAGTVREPDLLPAVVADAANAITAVNAVGSRALLLARLAQAAADGGQHDTARSLLGDAEHLVSAMSDSDRVTDVLTMLVNTAVTVGDLRRARVIAAGITGQTEQHAALTDVALAASEAGDHEWARSVLDDIADPSARHEALKALAARATAAGDHDRARSLALSATEDLRGDVLAWLAQVATATGDHERALSLVRVIPRGVQAWHLVWLVRAAVAGGDHERARAVAEELTGYNRDAADRYLSGEIPAARDLYADTNPAEPFVDIVVAAADRGTVLAVARDLAVDFGYANPLARAVDAEIAAGDLEQALAIAREITDPGQRNPVLARVIEAVAAAGDTAQARALLAEVLVLGPWDAWVELVARVAPDALVPVLDELEARCQ